MESSGDWSVGSRYPLNAGSSCFLARPSQQLSLSRYFLVLHASISLSDLFSSPLYLSPGIVTVQPSSPVSIITFL